MYDIGIIGDYDSICGFAAVGFTLCSVSSAEQARRELKAMVAGNFGVIFITEPLAEQLASELQQYNQSEMQCIIPIPAHTGSTGFSNQLLRQYVERAVGSDIIFDDDDE